VGDPIGTSVFTTSDGLAVHVTVLKGEKDIWARFSADGGETTPGDKAASDKPPSDKIKDEAAKLNAKLAGWTFQLGSWKQAALTPDLDALKAPPPAPTSAAAPAPTATPAPPAAPPTAPTAAPTAAPAAAQPAAPTAAPSRAPAARKP
jgi:hypothetical protein